MRAALVQLTSSDNPSENLATVSGLIDRAVAAGADFVLTPEVTNYVGLDRAHRAATLVLETEDMFLRAMQEKAQERGVWLSIGSLALRGAGNRFVNRSFLIDETGKIVARYDKIHMFDVTLSETETYKESTSFDPGLSAVVAETPFGTLGLSICYDLRFPHLYRQLAKSGAEIFLVPSAFATQTGEAHWEPLLRARAIENGCYVLAAAQTGTHHASVGPSRLTYGHSLAIDPWGKVCADAGQEPGIIFIEIDIGRVAQVRQKIPSLMHDREFSKP